MKGQTKYHYVEHANRYWKGNSSHTCLFSYFQPDILALLIIPVVSTASCLISYHTETSTDGGLIVFTEIIMKTLRLETSWITKVSLSEPTLSWTWFGPSVRTFSENCGKNWFVRFKQNRIFSEKQANPPHSSLLTVVGFFCGDNSAFWKWTIFFLAVLHLVVLHGAINCCVFSNLTAHQHQQAYKTDKF